MNIQNSQAISGALAQAVVVYRQWHHQGHVRTVLCGSGVIYDAEGVIVTNEHVIRRKGNFVVETASGRRYPATVVRSNLVSDVAVLRIKPEETLSAVTFAEQTPAVGDFVFAIGTPITHRFKNTVTCGYISHPRRFDPKSHIQCMPVLQANVLTGSGNSGGGLFNERGEFVGLNTLYFDLSGAMCSGYSFSVGATDVRWVVEQILATGRGPSRYKFGVDINPVGPTIAKAYGLEKAVGVMVEQIEENSLAAKCGLEVGDILHTIGDIADISCPDALDYALMRGEGNVVDVQIVRAGTAKTLALKLPQKRRQKSVRKQSNGAYTPFGLQISRRERGVGVKITSVAPGSNAAIEGFVGGEEVILALQNPETGDWEVTADLPAYKRLARLWQGRCVAAKVVTSDGPSTKGIQL